MTTLNYDCNFSDRSWLLVYIYIDLPHISSYCICNVLCCISICMIIYICNTLCLIFDVNCCIFADFIKKMAKAANIVH